MPSKEKRLRIERGLYRTGTYYYACATPPGSRAPMWRALGQLRLMEARRLRDKFAAEVQGAQPIATRTRATFADVAAEWLAEQEGRQRGGEVSPRALEIYEIGPPRPGIPRPGGRPPRPLTPAGPLASVPRPPPA